MRNENAFSVLLNRIDIKQICIALCVAGSIVLQYIQLQWSCDGDYLFLTYLFVRSFLLFVFNLLVLFLFTVTICLLLRRWWYALLVTDILFCVWAVANYYTIRFHGDPLFPSEFANIRTAANVLRNYSFVPGKKIVMILFLFVLELALLFLLRTQEKSNDGGKHSFRVRCVLELSVIILLYGGLFGSSPVMSRNAIGWNWTGRVETYGFVLSCVSDAVISIAPYEKPEGYDEAMSELSITDFSTREQKNPEQLPDFIVILNETFCDLGYYPGISGAWYFDYFYSIENAVFGKAIVPNTGGGTNDSECELLTSHSLRLMKNGTPFNYLNFNICDDNSVNYLKSLGYSTAAMHNANGHNYRRNVQYPAMGFDQTFFRDDFTRRSYFGNRYALDSDDYLEMEDVYHRMGEGGRFIYLLTYQNHGGYDQNDPELDYMHTDDDLGDLTDEVNEYLTSVFLSVQSFRELVSYYETVDRPVAILMVGDHAPSFIRDLPLPDGGEWDQSFMTRFVPYIVWANFPLETDGLYTDYASMTDLIPMMFRMCSMPLSPYYEAILDLHNELPVRTKDGMVIDSHGMAGSAGEDHPAWEKIRRYHALEYAALTKDSKYRKEWYVP